MVESFRLPRPRVYLAAAARERNAGEVPAPHFPEGGGGNIRASRLREKLLERK
jgi:hypothetical protein